VEHIESRFLRAHTKRYINVTQESSYAKSFGCIYIYICIYRIYYYNRDITRFDTFRFRATRYYRELAESIYNTQFREKSSLAFFTLGITILCTAVEPPAPIVRVHIL